MKLLTILKSISLRQWLEAALVAGLLLSMTWQLRAGIEADGTTFDEPIHLISGYITLTDHHMIIDPEHPPLAKMWGALPLLWLQPNIPSEAQSIAAEDSQLQSQTYYEANKWGWDLLFREGNNPYELLTAGRWMMALLAVVSAMVMWAWSRQLFGRVAGLITLALFSFDPTVLAHGHYINTDMAAVLFFVLSLASLWQLLQRRQARWLVVTGLAMGLGLLSKFSLLVLLGLVPLLMGAWLVYGRKDLAGIALDYPFSDKIGNLGRRLLPNWGQAGVILFGYVGGLMIVLGLAIGLVWLMYGLLWLLNPEQNTLWALAAGSPISFIWFFLPGMYAKGISVIGGDRSGYLLGMCYRGSRIEYFPTVTLFKMPLAGLILIWVGIIGSVAWLRESSKQLNPMNWPFSLWFLGLAIGVYYTFSMFAGVNIGVRHVLPAYSLLLILAGWVGASLWHGTFIGWRRAALGLRRGGRVLVIGLLGWLVWASWQASPHFLPYYNELSGEPRPLPWVANDSNTDWGEGGRALAAWAKERGIEEIAFNNFNGWNDAQFLGLKVVPARADNRDYRGYVAISRSSLIYNYCGMGNYSWRWLVEGQEPVAIVGGVINVYLVE